MARLLAVIAAACASIAFVGALNGIGGPFAADGEATSLRRTSLSRHLLALTADPSSCAVSVQRRFNCSEPACEDIQSNAGGYINYLMAEECTMEGAKWLGWVLIALWGLFLIYMLGDTADVFLCPTLDTIVEIWSIDPNIAGLTFLALANGSSDVAAAVASFLSGVGQVGISAILGAGVFITTLVVGAVSLVGEVRVDRRPFLRDAGFNVLAILYLYYAFQDNEVHLTEAMGFNLLYVVFAVVVVVGRRVYQTNKRKRIEREAALTGGGLLNVVGAGSDGAGGEADQPTRRGGYAPVSGAGGGTRSVSDVGTRSPGMHPAQPEVPLLAAPIIRGVHPLSGSAAGAEAGTGAWAEAGPSQAPTVRTESDPMHALSAPRTRFFVVPGTRPARWFERHTRHTHRLMTHLQRGEAATVADQVALVERQLRVAHEHEHGHERGQGREWDRGGWPVAVMAAEEKLGMGRGSGGGPGGRASRAGGPLQALAEDEARSRAWTHESELTAATLQASEADSPSEASRLVRAAARRDEQVKEEAAVEAAEGACAWCNRSLVTLLQVALYWVLLPAVLVRRVSVPVLVGDDYDWRFCSLTPLFGFPLIALVSISTVGDATGAWAVTFGSRAFCPLALAAYVGLVCTVVSVWRLPRAEPPTGATLLVLTLYGFVGSVAWIIMIANEIVTLLQELGMLLGISSTMLGLTVLAWGNSLGDLVADLSVARAGQPRMAIAACYAGPLFNLLIGLGLSLTIGTAKGGTVSLQTGDDKNKHTVWVCFVFMLISLVSSMIVVPLSGFRIRPWWGGCLVVIYLAFLACSIAVQL